MAFNTTTTVPSPNSPVTVKFAGLMLLKAGLNNTCEVGVHHRSDFHTFQAILIVNKPNRPLSLIRLITGPLTAPVSIRVTPAPPAGFQVFSQEPFGPNNPNSHEFDHRWALNLRSLHPGVDYDDGARPVLTLNSGILYASTLTRQGLNPQLAPAPPEEAENQPAPTPSTTQASAPPNRPLHVFAADLAVAIDIPPNSGVQIKWEESGAEPKEQVLKLPRDTDPAGTTYTIQLINDPLTSNPPAHDELALYYKVLREAGREIPLARQFRIQVPQGRSDEVPCMPVILDP